jgi:hypothetical protein
MLNLALRHLNRVPRTYHIDGIDSYKASELRDESANFFSGCSNVRNLIHKHNIPQNRYAFATFAKHSGDYQLSNPKDRRSSLFVNKLWMDEQLNANNVIAKQSSTDVLFRDIKKVLSRSFSPISCIYTFVLGNVGDLREQLHIDDRYEDHDYVIKFGRTNDLARRTREHEKTYACIRGSSVSLLRFVCVDPSLNAMAEGMLREFFSEHVIEYLQHKELAVLRTTSFRAFQERLRLIDESCMLRMRVLLQQVEHLQEANSLLREMNDFLKHKDG